MDLTKPIRPFMSAIIVSVLPKSAGRFLALMAGSIIFISCAAPVDDPGSAAGDSLPASEALATAARNLAGSSANGNPPEEDRVTASITDINEGGVSGEWGVSVDFQGGCGDGCTIDVLSKRTGDLLARDTVYGAGGEPKSHRVRFRHRGKSKDLHVRVVEAGSGDILAEVAGP